jgi:hypothetical protein
MAGTREALLQKIAETDEVEIETRRDKKTKPNRVTIWIVPTRSGVFIRSYKGKKGHWYREALANPLVTIRVGRRKVAARAAPERRPTVIREVNAGYRSKYSDRWPEDTEAMLRRSVVPTTLRLVPA